MNSTIKTTPMKASENPVSIRGIVLKNNIEDEEGEEIVGRFYEENELQHTDY